ncbi:hypothetical protein MMC32_007449 [Xylographa parallela]|nr:hypothetical protein [Xylographa parallela]
MQRAVLQPFPELTQIPLSSLSESQRLDTLIQNLEAHHRNVKAALLAASLSTLSTLTASSAAPTDPRLAARAAQHSLSDSQDALLASLKIPYNKDREKSDPNIAATAKKEDRFFGELRRAMERLSEYERGSTGVVDGLKAERERFQEKERVEQMGKQGAYDRERDPRLRR